MFLRHILVELFIFLVTDVYLGNLDTTLGFQPKVISCMGRRTDMEVTILTMVIQSSKRKEIQRLEELSPLKQRSLRIATFVFIDAGGTFLGELKVLKERYPNSKFIIIVCHAVNDKGLVNMCNNFDQVIVSNSHRDINYRPSNENLTVIDVCK